MTRKNKRELERAVEDLDNARNANDGFRYFVIGGDPDLEKTGHYTWDPDRGTYVNAAGHERSAVDAPDGGFEFNIEYPEDQ